MSYSQIKSELTKIFLEGNKVIVKKIHEPLVKGFHGVKV